MISVLRGLLTDLSLQLFSLREKDEIMCAAKELWTHASRPKGSWPAAKGSSGMVSEET